MKSHSFGSCFGANFFSIDIAIRRLCALFLYSLADIYLEIAPNVVAPYFAPHIRCTMCHLIHPVRPSAPEIFHICIISKQSKMLDYNVKLLARRERFRHDELYFSVVRIFSGIPFFFYYFLVGVALSLSLSHFLSYSALTNIATTHYFISE